MVADFSAILGHLVLCNCFYQLLCFMNSEMSLNELQYGLATINEEEDYCMKITKNICFSKKILNLKYTSDFVFVSNFKFIYHKRFTNFVSLHWGVLRMPQDVYVIISWGVNLVIWIKSNDLINHKNTKHELNIKLKHCGQINILPICSLAYWLQNWIELYHLSLRWKKLAFNIEIDRISKNDEFQAHFLTIIQFKKISSANFDSVAFCSYNISVT